MALPLAGVAPVVGRIAVALAMAVAGLAVTAGELSAQEQEATTTKRRCTVEPYNCSPESFQRDASRQARSEQVAIERKKATQEIFRPLELLYFSNRKSDPAYLSERSPNFAKAFTDEIGDADIFGKVVVAVPRNRDPAQKSYVGDTELKSPRWHFYLFQHSGLSERELVTLAKARHTDDHTPQVFFYVHGVRNSLVDAAETLAQLVVDTNFAGRAVFMSWPAPKTLLPNDVNYRENTALARQSVDLLAGVLEHFLLEGGADLHLLAHSAGADLSVRALRNVAQPVSKSPSLATIVLAASDSELPQFGVAVAPILVLPGRIVVSYCSETDRALQESRRINRTTRLGDCSESAPSAAGVETVIVRGALKRNDWVGHSYFLWERAVLDDISSVIVHRLRATVRKALARDGNIWVLDVDKSLKADNNAR